MNPVIPVKTGIQSLLGVAIFMVSAAAMAQSDDPSQGRGRKSPSTLEERGDVLPLPWERAGERVVVAIISLRRRDARVAEGGALLRRYMGLNPYRGFESLSLRQDP
jgi:hypothetical protein